MGVVRGRWNTRRGGCAHRRRCGYPFVDPEQAVRARSRRVCKLRGLRWENSSFRVVRKVW